MARKITVKLGVILGVCVLYILTMKLPMQQLKITAQTTAEEFDLSDQIRLYHLNALKAGESHTATITFMAVPNTSRNLFTRFGTGQCVYLGCSELKAECNFISLGRFLNIRLKLNMAQTDLKLEDGTPFDITRYSLRPVLTIQNNNGLSK